MTRTGAVVTLEVAKQGAIYHGLATLLNQPSPMMQRGELLGSERKVKGQEMQMFFLQRLRCWNLKGFC